MNWFDFIVLGILALSFIKGYKSGFVMQLATLAGFVVSAIFAGKLSELVAPKLIEFIDDIPAYIISPLSYTIAFILILVAFFFVGKVFESLLKFVMLGFINKLLGAVFSATKWVLVFGILLSLLSELDKNKTLFKEEFRDKSLTFNPIMKVAQSVVPFLKFDN